jgi:hypothetical protein
MLVEVEFVNNKLFAVVVPSKLTFVIAPSVVVAIIPFIFVVIIFVVEE